MYDLIQGRREADIFSQGNVDNRPRTLAEAIKEVLKIDYNGKTGSNIVGVGSETGIERRRGSTGDVERGGRGTEGERAADGKGRAKGDAGEEGVAEKRKALHPSSVASKDNQGNPLNVDGTLKLEKVKSVDDLTDEDFSAPTRNVELPAIPKNVDDAIGANGKPIIIKKNIFEKNWNTHKFPFDESRSILKAALYGTDLVGRTQPTKKPLHWVAIKLDEKSPIVVLEVNENKDNVEIVGWYTLDERNLERIKRQAEKNGGELVMLFPKDKVESLSTPLDGLSSDGKDTAKASKKQGKGKKKVEPGQQVDYYSAFAEQYGLDAEEAKKETVANAPEKAKEVKRLSNKLKDRYPTSLYLLGRDITDMEEMVANGEVSPKRVEHVRSEIKRLKGLLADYERLATPEERSWRNMKAEHPDEIVVVDNGNGMLIVCQEDVKATNKAIGQKLDAPVTENLIVTTNEEQGMPFTTMRVTLADLQRLSDKGVKYVVLDKNGNQANEEEAGALSSPTHGLSSDGKGKAKKASKKQGKGKKKVTVEYDLESNTWKGIPKEANLVSTGKAERGIVEGFTNDPRIRAMHSTRTGKTWLRVDTFDNNAETPARINSVLEGEGYEIDVDGDSSGFVDFNNFEEAKRFADHVENVQEQVDAEREYKKALDYEGDVEDKWEVKIQDYVAEHYPTQATVSAETKSAKGLEEREAMKSDSVLRAMREKADAEKKKAADATFAAWKKMEARQHKADVVENPSHGEEVLRDAVIDKLRESGIEVLGATEGQKVLDEANGRGKLQMGDAPETFAERQKQAVENRGVVMPGLNKTYVEVVKDIPRHGYTGTIAEATKQAIQKARDKYAPEGKAKVLHYDNNGVEFDYVISGNAIEICLSPKHQAKSGNKGVHLALAEHLDEVINKSVEVEEHPDYIKGKDGKRGEDINPDALMHRFYGVAVIDGVPCRVMTLMREDGRTEIANGIHSYEVQKIEVLDNELPSTSNGVGTPINEISAHPLAKLLKGVEKSYDKGKKLLEESKKRSAGLREQRVYHGSGADFDHFDHSHMGEGEGAQAYGWGTYVTEVEGIGRTYAEQNPQFIEPSDYDREKANEEIAEKTLARFGHIDCEFEVMYDGAGGFEIFDIPRDKNVLEQFKDYFKSHEEDFQSDSYIDDFDLNDEDDREQFAQDVERSMINYAENIAHDYDQYWKGIEQRILYTVEIPDDTGSNYLD